MAAIIGLAVFNALLAFALLALIIYADIHLANKMNLPWWTLLIPLFREYKICEKLYGNGWIALGGYIPVYHLFYDFKSNIDLAHVCGFSTTFAVIFTFIGGKDLMDLIIGLSNTPCNFEGVNHSNDPIWHILANMTL